MSDCLIAAFYRFLPVSDPAAWRDAIAALAVDLKGTVLVAPEGVNGGVAGTPAAVERFLDGLRLFPGLANLPAKCSRAERPPYRRLLVKLRREVVGMGVPGLRPDLRTGGFVAPADWDALLAEPGWRVLDVRNDYEVRLGTFAGSLNPGTRNFHDFPAFAARALDPARDRNVAMFCTGGIRCEKASAHLLDRGFEKVVQLQDGILGYLAERGAASRTWQGECFVFDHRVAVDRTLAPGAHALCHACREPLTAAELASDTYRVGVSCPYCATRTDDARRASLAERQRQRQLRQARAA